MSAWRNHASTGLCDAELRWDQAMLGEKVAKNFFPFVAHIARMLYDLGALVAVLKRQL